MVAVVVASLEPRRNHARGSRLAGAEVSFPVGTYWLRRFAHVPLGS